MFTSSGKLKMLWLVRGFQIVTNMVCIIVKVTHTQVEFYYFHSKGLLRAQKQCRILTTYKKSCIFKDHTPDEKKKLTLTIVAFHQCFQTASEFAFTVSK